MDFPKDFVWGAATSAFQIEGAVTEDGKGLSVWDMFCRKTGAVWDGRSAETACDHYHLYRRDVALMKELGLRGYRMSVSWPRIIPEGTGRVNARGLDFYDRLVDELLAAEITPFITIFHWDYPYALYCRGGWLNPESPDWFAEFTRVVVEKLSDRVVNWITLNEPQCFIGFGHQTGRHAPGDRLDLPEVLQAGHHALLAHGKSVMAIRRYAKQKSRIGYAPVGVVRMPASGRRGDVEAARQAMFSITDKDCWNVPWWVDPVLLGKYPADGVKLFGKAIPPIRPNDLKIICQPIDFLGANIYVGKNIRTGKSGEPETVPFPPGYALTTYRWAVTPEALYWGPRFLFERYRAPIVVTESGMGNLDWVSLDGAVHDPQRIDYLNRYLLELKRAIDDGVDVRGYFCWSVMDNFEWAEGFRERFGLVYVDFTTQKRIFKDSACWYKKVIHSNGAGLK